MSLPPDQPEDPTGTDEENIETADDTHTGSAYSQPDDGDEDEAGRTTEAGEPVYREGAALKTPRRMALDAAFRNDADLRLGLTENLSEVRIRSEALDERVERAFKDFKPAVPAEGEPARPNRVEPGTAPFEAVGRVMRDRLDALKTAATGPGITIRANSSLIAWHGGSDEAGDAKTGTIEFGKLIEFLDARGVSSLTLSNSPAVAACQAEGKARAVLHEIESAAESAEDAAESAEDGDDGDTPVASASNSAALEPEKVAAFVEISVNEQMEPATAPEAKLEYGLIPNGADSNAAQARLLETFQLRPGPSDVTSYHDFSTLQIAFDDVWAQIFDGELDALGRQVYREYVGLLDFLGYDPDDPDTDRPISSLDDLAWLIGEIRSLSQIAQDGLPPGAGGHGGGEVGTRNVPQDPNDLQKDAEEWLDENFPGGRVGAAIGTLGISELVLLFIGATADMGRKDPLPWDDLVNARSLPRGDRIIARVEDNVFVAGNIQLVLRTDIGNRKEIAFQSWEDKSKKPLNEVRVGNWKEVGAEIRTDNSNPTFAQSEPAFFESRALISPSKLANGLLEFASQDVGETAAGRYVLGDLDKIVADGGRLTFYWKDR